MSWPVPPHGFLGSQASTAATDNDTYQISKSLRFNSADSTYLSRTPSVAGNRKTWTFSAWAKRTTVGSAQANYILGNAQAPSGTNGVYFGFGSDTLFFGDYGASGWDWYVQSSSLYRDTSAWYHVVAQYDTTQATASERVKLYVNGVRLTAFDGASTYPTLNVDGRFNQASVGMAIGRLGTYDGNYFNGYITEINFIDGQALTPSSFGETDAITGRWKAKAYAGTYGTNGFYLPFSNNSGVTATTLGKDNSTYRMLTTGLNGTTNGIQRGADLTGNANGKTGTISMWWDFTGASSGFQVLWSSRHNTTIGTSLNTYRDANGKIGISALNSAGTTILSAVTTTNVAASSGIYHVYMAWDMAVNNQVKIYVNGVDQALTISTFTNDTIQYVVPNHGLGGNLFGPFAPTTPGMVGQVYVNYATYLDPVTNISKFYGGTSTPIGIGTSGEIPSGSSPIVYLDGNATTILTNRGTGGNFAAFGTLATGTTYEGVGSHYNNWTPNNLSVTPGVGNDSLTDSPSNYGAISTTLVNDTYQISKSLRFNSADSAYLSRTPSVAGNRKTWTWSGWVKRGVGTDWTIFSAVSDANNATLLRNYGDVLDFTHYISSFNGRLTTTSVFRDYSAWYHIVAVFDTANATAGNRMRLYVNGSELTAFSADTAPTQNSDGILNSASAHYLGVDIGFNSYYMNGYLAEVNFIDGQALTPTSFGTRDINTYLWKPKAYTGTYGTNGFYLNFSDSSNTTATTLGKDQAGSNNWTPNNFSVSAGPGNDSLVDSPTYYGTDTGVGGEARGNYCTLDPIPVTNGTFSQGNLRYVGPGNWKRANGTIAVSTGKWYYEATLGNAPFSPRTLSSGWNAFGFGLASVLNSTTGANGVSDAVTLADSGYYTNFNGFGTDGGTAFSSGDVLSVAVDLDANTYTFRRNNTQIATGTIGGTAGRLLTPCIISYDGQYGVMDVNFGQRPFIHAAPSGFRALRDYNKLPTPTGGEVRGNYATLNPLDAVAVTSTTNGNLDVSLSASGSANIRSTIAVSSGKWFWEVLFGSTGDTLMVGACDATVPNASSLWSTANAWMYYSINGNKYNGGATNYGATFTNGDLIGIALDMDSGTISFYKNGVSQGQAYSGLTGKTLTPTIQSSVRALTATANFGQRPWAYDAPFGFKPLCTTLLPQPIVQKPSSYMDVVTYTGNSATQTISSLGFSPDLVWLKRRNLADSNGLFDSVRGAGRRIQSNDTTAEVLRTDVFTSFNTNGFSITGSDTQSNVSGSTYVAWAWDESPIAGMDIVTFTAPSSGNTTVSHSLGVSPRMIIAKSRNSATSWTVYHASATNKDQYLFLSGTNSVQTLTDVWGSSAPTSSVFGFNSNNQGASASVIAYCFAEVEGFSKFGSYTGNGSADGPFVYCGFRPRWVLFKNTTLGSHWVVYDTARETINPLSAELAPNNPNAENGTMSAEAFDILSNGFKLRSVVSGEMNVSNSTYIFAAFAESPFKYSRAR